MQHIALITTSYPDHAPGIEAAGSFVEDFARELSRHIRVTVVAASTADSLSTEGGLSVRRFAVPKYPLSLLNPLRPTHWGPILNSLRSGRHALEQLVRDDIPDHVFALWVLPCGYWAKRVAEQHGIGFSVWALGSDIWGLGKVPVVRQILKKVLRQADRRYADGLLLAADVEELCGLRCEFLPSTRLLPLSRSAKRAREAPYNLAFLGRWHRNKGIDLLLNALGHLTDQDWNRISGVRINGGGPMHDQVQRAARDLIERQRPVTVGTYLNKEAAAELIEWADYLLLPSRIESIPVIFSDAMQLHTPIIAMPVGDLPRLHAKYRYGVIATDPTSTAYAEAIHAALGMNTKAFSAGLETARTDFNLPKIVKRFVQDTIY